MRYINLLPLPLPKMRKAIKYEVQSSRVSIVFNKKKKKRQPESLTARGYF